MNYIVSLFFFALFIFLIKRAISYANPWVTYEAIVVSKNRHTSSDPNIEINFVYKYIFNINNAEYSLPTYLSIGNFNSLSIGKKVKVFIVDENKKVAAPLQTVIHIFLISVFSLFCSILLFLDS